jgi:hypothetical protein
VGQIENKLPFCFHGETATDNFFYIYLTEADDSSYHAARFEKPRQIKQLVWAQEEESHLARHTL